MAFLAPFGGHEDHAVGGTGTVDGRCTGVLEDLHRFDIVRVDVAEAGALGAVNDDQRRTRTVQRGTATEHDARRGTRVTGSLGYVKTCHGTGKGLRRVGVHTGGQRLFLHGGDGVRHLRTELAATISGNHRFLKHFVVFGKDDADRLAVENDFLCHVADAGDHEDISLLGVRLHEIAVEVGHGAQRDGLSLDEDGSTDHTQALCVENDTPADLILLSVRSDSRFSSVELAPRQQKAACQQGERSHFQKSFHKVMFWLMFEL